MPTDGVVTRPELDRRLASYRVYDARYDIEHRRLAKMLTATGEWTITSTTSPQLTVRYDESNTLGISVSSAGAVTYNATGASAGHAFSDAVTVNSTVTVAAGSTTNALVVTTTGAIQQSLRYDASNRLDISVSSAGAVTFNATGASAGFTFSDPVTCSSTLAVTGVATLTGGAKWASGNESTGAGTPLLGTNSPASTLAAPNTWLVFKKSDDTTLYVPAWA